jgi:ferredoxin
MRRYLKRLSAVENGRAAVVCTIGDELVTHRDGRRTHIPGFEGHALVEAAAILRRRGYDVFLTDAIPYPLNWTQVVSAPRPDICAELWRGGDEKAAAVARRIAAGERSIRRFSRAHLLWTLPFDRLYALIGRRRLARLFVSGSNCNACGFCVRNCPAQAIKLVAARPRWTMKCEGCQRCINTCPGNAIQTSWLRVIAELVLTLLPLLPLILRLQDGHRARLLGAAINPWVELLLWAMAYALCFALTDAVSFACEFVPGLRWLVRLNFTRHYRRYLEPHFRPR